MVNQKLKLNVLYTFLGTITQTQTHSITQTQVTSESDTMYFEADPNSDPLDAAFQWKKLFRFITQ